MDLGDGGHASSSQSFFHSDSSRDRNMPSPAALTIYLFGATALLAGVSSLIDSSSSTSQLDFPLACTPVARGNALAAIAMGLYYTLAAYQENSTFFVATVPMRLLTTAVFFSQGWSVPAIWEGAGAVITGFALLIGRCVSEKSKKN
ncbi:hypothetical protein F4782DRAFT_61369 [Xylaria castorea]|nr:hypothetical protein F4782DRAFT_61369 [Xylaria castorea]